MRPVLMASKSPINQSPIFPNWVRHLQLLLLLPGTFGKLPGPNGKIIETTVVTGCKAALRPATNKAIHRPGFAGHLDKVESALLRQRSTRQR